MSQLEIDSLAQVSDRHYAWRFALLFVLGVVVAGALTLFMHALIQASHKELDDSAKANFLDFVRVKRDETSTQNRRKPTRPEEQQAPPAPPTPQSNQQAVSEGVLEVAAPSVESAIDVDIGAIGVGQGDGEYLPIVKVAPVYPIKASMEGIEGTCLVEYTVTETGATKDVQTVQGQCPKLFVRASLDAAKKFKYKPRIIDGETIEVPHVQNLFRFTLHDRNEQ
ncbi:energy transducer TonB [Alteromonas facilis]|uniref:energy transducer TonB n=1 Tax=Alteromonas facilis TaxID=2048004 RepID=UPI000C28CD13|nr:energy transducer TonB [Alteromonas facilis]